MSSKHYKTFVQSLRETVYDFTQAKIWRERESVSDVSSSELGWEQEGETSFIRQPFPDDTVTRKNDACPALHRRFGFRFHSAPPQYSVQPIRFYCIIVKIAEQIILQFLPIESRRRNFDKSTRSKENLRNSCEKIRQPDQVHSRSSSQREQLYCTLYSSSRVSLNYFQ